MVVVWNNSPRVDMSLHSYTLDVQAYPRQSWYCGIASSFVLDHFNLIDLDFVARVPDTRPLLKLYALSFICLKLVLENVATI